MRRVLVFLCPVTELAIAAFAMTFHATCRRIPGGRSAMLS